MSGVTHIVSLNVIHTNKSYKNVDGTHTSTSHVIQLRSCVTHTNVMSLVTYIMGHVTYTNESCIDVDDTHYTNA